MAISDYSASAGSNTSISGINIAEGGPAANINNAIRQMMADAKAFYVTVAPALVGGRVAPDADFTTHLSDISILSADDGSAKVVQDLDALFTTTYTVNATNKYVAPWGSDGNGGTSWADAYLTLGKTRAVTCGTVYIAPGFYAHADWRYTDTAGTSPRRFIAPFGGVTIGTSGTAVSGLTFSANGTYPNVYETALADPPIVNRLLRTDILDSAGIATPMPRYASLADVNTAGYGWFHDTTADKLYVCVGATNVNTSFKANLLAVYMSATTNQVLLYSSVSYWENIIFQGNIYALFVAGQAQPVAFLKRCGFQYSFSHALLSEGGKTYTQDCTNYRSGGDGANYNLGVGLAPCYFLENNYRSLESGDEDSFPGQTSNPAASSYNKQGSSNHNALGIRVGGFHDRAAGQIIADTMDLSVRSKTWMLGVGLGRSRAPISSNVSYGLYVQNADSYIENMTVPDSGNGAIYADGNAVINNANLRGTRAGAGTYTPYTPVTA